MSAALSPSECSIHHVVDSCGSESTTSTRIVSSRIPARFTVVVLFPTPPLPFATAIMFTPPPPHQVDGSSLTQLTDSVSYKPCNSESTSPATVPSVQAAAARRRPLATLAPQPGPRRSTMLPVPLGNFSSTDPPRDAYT